MWSTQWCRAVVLTLGQVQAFTARQNKMDMFLSVFSCYSYVYDQYLWLYPNDICNAAIESTWKVCTLQPSASFSCTCMQKVWCWKEEKRIEKLFTALAGVLIVDTLWWNVIGARGGFINTDIHYYHSSPTFWGTPPNKITSSVSKTRRLECTNTFTIQTTQYIPYMGGGGGGCTISPPM